MAPRRLLLLVSFEFDRLILKPFSFLALIRTYSDPSRPSVTFTMSPPRSSTLYTFMMPMIPFLRHETENFFNELMFRSRQDSIPTTCLMYSRLLLYLFTLLYRSYLLSQCFSRMFVCISTSYLDASSCNSSATRMTTMLGVDNGL